MKNLRTRLGLVAATVGTLAMLSLGYSATQNADLDPAVKEHYEKISEIEGCFFDIKDFPLPGQLFTYKLSSYYDLIPEGDNDPDTVDVREQLVSISYGGEKPIHLAIWETLYDIRMENGVMDGKFDHYVHGLDNGGRHIHFYTTDSGFDTDIQGFDLTDDDMQDILDASTEFFYQRLVKDPQFQENFDLYCVQSVKFPETVEIYEGLWMGGSGAPSEELPYVSPLDEFLR